MTLRHVVSWTLAATDPDQKTADAREIARRLEALVGVVPSLRALTVGLNTYYTQTNADVVLIADFDDLEGLDAYQVHPAHQEVGAFVRTVVSGRMAVDFDL